MRPAKVLPQEVIGTQPAKGRGKGRWHGVLQVGVDGSSLSLSVVCPHFHHSEQHALYCAKRLRTRLRRA